MNPTSTSVQPQEGVEPIPGYVLQRRLGAGGYGEVWSAQAPGGLQKAVKFVFGGLDDARAARELKSLNRIKEISHPFLLSIERIEAIGNQLIIVTELAESSLKDRFDECVQLGKEGIPRDELLQYMQDTADALDFLHQKHSLQHLDIKPENLLLLAGRVKVGDFGLLKDLQDHCVSMVGGMTPLYTPPEVFDGRPNRHSDQYSLAIVYHEMLTGVPPFSGRTAAQLAAQHLNSAPTLTKLPHSDQSIIAQAMAKEPERRFPNCRTFVDQLRTSKQFIASSANEPHFEEEEEDSVLQTQVLGQTSVNQPSTASLGTDVLTPCRGEVVHLNPIELDDLSVDGRPTLVIGIGGTGKSVLEQLHLRMVQRFGALSNFPCCQLLLLDTDVRAISALFNQQGSYEHPSINTLSLPLRETKDYRENSKKLLSWMSRRWLYNIPRSLQTEGLRPLGRLAFVDHSQSVLQHLQNLVSTATDPENCQIASEKSGIAIDAESIQVVIVSSVSGGTGGGAVLDVAYAVKNVLDSAAVANHEVIGILTHSTPAQAKARDLADANALASLIELNHYNDPSQCYPGDEACKLPSHAAGEATFSDTYFVHLGNELNDDQFHAATDRIAEYLYQQSFTPTKQFFEKARLLSREVQSNPVAEGKLRTFALTEFDALQSLVPMTEIHRISRQRVLQWLSGPDLPSNLEGGEEKRSTQSTRSEQVDPRIVTLGKDFTDSIRLDLEPLVQAGHQAIEKSVGGDVVQYWNEVLLDLLNHLLDQAADVQAAPDLSALFDLIDSHVVFDQTERSSSDCQSLLQNTLSSLLKEQVESHLTSIRNLLFQLVNQPVTRLEGALQLAQWFVRHLGSIQRSAQQIVKRLYQEASLVKQRMLAASPSAPTNSSNPTATSPQVRLTLLQQYANLRTAELTHSFAVQLVASIRTGLETPVQELRQMQQKLFELLEHLPAVESKNADPADKAVTRRNQVLIQSLDAKMTDENSVLSHLQSESLDVQQWAEALKDEARRVIQQDTETQTLKESTLILDAEEPVTIGDCVKQATPELMQCGGAQRLLAVPPHRYDTQQLIAELEQVTRVEPTVVRCGTTDQILLCCEAEDVPISRIASLLGEQRSDLFDIASRLHTRNDVNWTRLR